MKIKVLCAVSVLLLLGVIAMPHTSHADDSTPTAQSTSAPTAISTAAATAASPIQISDQSVEGKFRQYLIFHLKASSTAGKIITAKVIIQEGGQPGGRARTVDTFTPDSSVTTQFKLDTSKMTTPPFQLLSYHWQITDDAGNTFTDVTHEAEFTDETRNWQQLSDGKVRVYWYDNENNPTFGQQLLDAAQQGYAHVVKATGHTPAHEIRVVVFNNQADFCSFYGPNECLDWLGGQTFGNLTVQWVSTGHLDYVLTQTIPHELAHAFLADWMGPRVQAIPLWFNEGQAVNNQIDGTQALVDQARTLASQGKLERIAFMEARTTIGRNQLKLVQNWYAEATAIVAYLYEQYGLDSLGKIVGEVNSGKTFTAAFEDTTGISMDEFEIEWRDWMGATDPMPTIAPSPTLMNFPPTPTFDTSFLTTPTPTLTPTP